MRYVKLNTQGGVLYDAPATLTIGGMVHFHPSDADYEADGWLRYVDTPMPETDPGEGMEWNWRTADDGNGSCVVIWEALHIPEPPEPGTSLADRLANVEEAVFIGFGGQANES